ncbi:unnamed protein product [Paramecium octaurelia]|uniref:H-type lectin domain-containing protein n=1 Tax=Paramecium octaurelia TaxID=43137 RepID=A0A8S1SEQ1_PAROT|nr:unnamed protein product [Paramecium octaurelia]
MAIIILLLLFLSVSSFITIDSGSYIDLNYTLGFPCQNNYQTTRTITFSNTFQNIPQVFIYAYQLDVPNDVTEFQFSIASIKNTNFQFTVKCTKAVRVYSVRYEWIAIDDKRVQVINSFNMNPPEDKVFNHELLNVDTAVIGITSLAIIGQIDFKLSITQLTPTSVSVEITKVTGKFQNLIQIGYQILLVSSRDIINKGLVTFSPDYTSPAMNSEQNKWLILPIKEYNLIMPANQQYECRKIQEHQQLHLVLKSGIVLLVHSRLRFKICGCHNYLQQIKHFNAKHQEQVKNQIFHNVQDRNLKSKYFNQIQYIMKLDNLQLRSLNQQQILISFCQQIVQQENMQSLNLINAMLVPYKNIINLITIVTHKSIQQAIFLSLPKQIQLIKSSPSQQQVQVVKLSRYFIIK